MGVGGWGGEWGRNGHEWAHRGIDQKGKELTDRDNSVVIGEEGEGGRGHKGYE